MEELCHSSQSLYQSMLPLKKSYQVKCTIRHLKVFMSDSVSLCQCHSLLLMREAWTMTSMKAKCSAAAGSKCYIAYHVKVCERKICCDKKPWSRENKDEKR